MKKKVGLVFLALVLMATAIAGCQRKVGDGQYDYDYGLVSIAGSDPTVLTEGVRAVRVGVFRDGNLLGLQIVNGFIYEHCVVVPAWAFYIQGYFAWEIPEISIKTFLLPDPGKEDTWRSEELGEVLNKEDIMNEGLDFAVVERVNPIFRAAQHTVGQYSDLGVGHKLYRTSQDNTNHTIVFGSEVIGLRTNGRNNLIDFQGQLAPHDLGGLLFALRDGQFELVGMICVIESFPWRADMVYLLALDIEEIIDYIETKIKTD